MLSNTDISRMNRKPWNWFLSTKEAFIFCWCSLDIAVGHTKMQSIYCTFGSTGLVKSVHNGKINKQFSIESDLWRWTIMPRTVSSGSCNAILYSIYLFRELYVLYCFGEPRLLYASAEATKWYHSALKCLLPNIWSMRWRHCLTWWDKCDGLRISYQRKS